MKTINTLKRAYNLTEQVSVQNLINNRINTKKGWENVKVTKEVIEQIAEQLSELIGGHGRTKATTYNNIINKRPQHWGLDRVFLEKTNSTYILRYCAGQDYPYEIKTIRNYIKNI